MELDLPDHLPGVERFDRVLTLLVGVAAVVAACLVALELASSRHAARADAQASVTAAAAYQGFIGSSLANQLKVTSVLESADRLIGAEIGTKVPATGVAAAYLAAESRAAVEQTRAVERTIRVPIRGSLAATHAAFGASAATDVALLRAQVTRSTGLVDEARRYGRRDGRATFALTLLASAGALFGLAGVLRAGRAGWVALGTGAAALLAAAAAGVVALLLQS
jgi:hypothetical protein